jgi:hypothetical protein
VSTYAAAMENDSRDARLAGFRHAERLFAAAVDAGVQNAELYANQGNAALQAERLGTAVLGWRRALLIEPGHARSLQNLDHVRGLLPEWVPTPPRGGLLDSFFFWQTASSRASRARAAAVAFALAALGLAGSVYSRSSGARYLAVLAALAWGTLVLSLVFDPARNAHREGVIVAEEAVARAADSINAPQRFGEPLPAGTEVKILENRGGWVQIELHNGRNAWVLAAAVEPVAPR